MPRGPKGEKRPADVIGNAVHVMRIATGEIEDKLSSAPKRAKGGTARAKALTPAQRSEPRVMKEIYREKPFFECFIAGI